MRLQYFKALVPKALIVCIDEGFAHFLPVEDDALITDLLSWFADTADFLSGCLAHLCVTAIGFSCAVLVLHLEW